MTAIYSLFSLCKGPSDETMYLLLLCMLVCIVGALAIPWYWIRKNPGNIRNRAFLYAVAILLYLLVAALPLLIAAAAVSILSY